MDENTKKMAGLLRSGYTMLNKSCPICNNPIFRDKRGEILCPICNRKVIMVDGNNNKNLESINMSENQIKSIGNEEKLATTEALKVTLKKKIEWIRQQLENEIHIDVIEKYSVILKNFFDLLSRIP
ncbi:MAG: Sjogren's syndrome/scleroderma autoantigen 1 family protein [Promethearchaeota archaeon]